MLTCRHLHTFVGRLQSHVTTWRRIAKRAVFMTKLRCLLYVCAFVSAGGITVAEDSAALKAQFSNPPRQYSSAPLWVWNDMLTDEEVSGTLRDLAGQKVKQAFVHPPSGPYDALSVARVVPLVEGRPGRGRAADMNLWIYDENSYPSGFAGGWVPELMPESRGEGLCVHRGEAAVQAGSTTCWPSSA